MTHYDCPGCQRSHHMDAALVPPRAGKALLGSLGFALASRTENAWAAIALAILGLSVGHLIDEEIAPRCPACGVVLRAVVASVTGA